MKNKLKESLNLCLALARKKTHILKEEFDHNYTLVVIRSILPEYRLAYYLNLAFSLQLKKEKFTLTTKAKKGNFSVFGFENFANNQYWALIANKQIIQEKRENDYSSLFIEISNTFTFLQEEKKADYLLKIENNNNITTAALIKKISSIHKVITSYAIDPNKLKAKNSLIF